MAGWILEGIVINICIEHILQSEDYTLL